MKVDNRDDAIVLKALNAQANGRHIEAANLFQQAGNQYRNLEEKKTLWNAAENARRIHGSD